MPGQPSGLAGLPDGRPLIVSMTDRTVLRREHDGTLVQQADLSSIATYHCNDIVVDDAWDIGALCLDRPGVFARRGGGRALGRLEAVAIGRAG